MSDAPTRWFDDEPDPPPRSRRLPVLLVAAAVPWVLVAALLQRSPSAPPEPPPASSATMTVRDDDPDDHQDEAPEAGVAELAPDADVPAGADGQQPAPWSAPGDALAAADAGTRVLHGVAEALVVAVARAWLTDAGPDLEVAGIEVDRRGYLEHVAVERIDLVTPGLAVATVTVVVLQRDEGRYVEALVRRAAVPLAVGPTTIHPAGTPWWLPTAPDLAPRPPVTEPDDDALVAAALTDALAAAGYRDTTVRDVRRGHDGALVADVTASTPAGEPITGDVWFVDAGDGAVVLGHHDDDT